MTLPIGYIAVSANLRCPYCYINKSAAPIDESVGRAAVAAVVQSAVTHGFSAVKLKYAGGEASLNHSLVIKLQKYASELTADAGLELHATLLSNGVRLPASLSEFCKAAGIRVMISLDGLAEQHDVQRPFANGKPSFHLDRTGTLNLLSDEKEGCRDCTWRYWCPGGCAVATFRATGRYDVKSPNCNIYRAVYPQALRLEVLRLLKYAQPENSVSAR